MHVQIATYCDSASEYDNRLCILGTLDTLKADAWPYRRNHCCVALKLMWGKSEEGFHTVRVSFMDEDGRPTLEELKSRLKVRVPKDQYFVSSNHVIHLHQLTFHAAGTYMATVHVDDVLAQEIQLQVIDGTGRKKA